MSHGIARYPNELISSGNSQKRTIVGWKKDREQYSLMEFAT